MNSIQKSSIAALGAGLAALMAVSVPADPREDGKALREMIVADAAAGATGTLVRPADPLIQ